MAKTPAKSAPAKSAPAKSAAQTTAETFDWATLPAAVTPEYTREFHRNPDVVANTPQAIKDRVNESYAAYKPAGHDPASPRKVVTSWRSQECGTKERAAEFIKLARKFAEHSDPRMTIRATIDEAKPTVVRYMAKPFEVRDRAA